MSCLVYIDRFSYDGIERGERKKAESKNGLSVLNTALHDALGLDLSSFTIERAEHGKPYFVNSGIMFNISHSGDYAAAALCECPVGVDIQIYRPIKESMINKLCSGAELEYINAAQDRSRAFIHLWTLKESYVKATGEGMTFPMDEINFDIRTFDEAKPLTGRFSNKKGLYHLRDFGEFSLAVCAFC